MENASKALIIAGAILLSILIIGLGMLIYNQAIGAIGNTGIDQQKVDTHNRQFVQYEGEQSGTTVRQLISNIMSYNITGAEDSSQFVLVMNGDASAVTSNGAADNVTGSTFNTDKKFTELRSKVRTGRNYNVSIGYDPNTGYVIAVGFVQVGATGSGSGT